MKWTTGHRHPGTQRVVDEAAARCSTCPVFSLPGVVFILFMLLAGAPRAQDIHFSQFFNTPLATSPGSIGAFDGDYRVHGIYRQQWRAVTRPYRTFGLGGDAANFLGKQGLGVGAWLFNDRAGDSRMNTFHFGLGATWTLHLGSEGAHGITLGPQVGFTSVSIDQRDLSFDAQYNGYYYDPTLANGESFARDAILHADVRAGIVYRWTPAKRQLIQTGLGFFNLNRPRVGFFGGPGEPIDLRGTFHLITQFPVGARTDLLPMLQFMRQGPYTELDAGAALRFILVDRYGVLRAVRLGAYYRAADAGYVYAGIEYDDWSAGVSYDINVSALVPASRNRGAIEFTVARVFAKRPFLPARFKACPDLM